MALGLNWTVRWDVLGPVNNWIWETFAVLGILATLIYWNSGTHLTQSLNSPFDCNKNLLPIAYVNQTEGTEWQSTFDRQSTFVSSVCMHSRLRRKKRK